MNTEKYIINAIKNFKIFYAILQLEKVVNTNSIIYYAGVLLLVISYNITIWCTNSKTLFTKQKWTIYLIIRSKILLNNNKAFRHSIQCGPLSLQQMDFFLLLEQ